MRQILETEDHVAVPPMMYSDPFYRITYLIKAEIRKFKWLEGEKGRQLSWAQARAEWIKALSESFLTVSQSQEAAAAARRITLPCF